RRRSRRTLSPWLWSLSVLVTVGAGWCEKPVNQPKEPTLYRRASSSLKATRAPFLADSLTNAEQFSWGFCCSCLGPARFAFSRRSSRQLIHKNNSASKKRKVGGTNYTCNRATWLPFFPETKFACCDLDTGPQQQIIHTGRWNWK